jgi:chromosome segregation ATPase
MKLYDAGMTIEISRKKLRDNQTAINAYDEMLKRERETRLKWSQSYDELYQQHGRTLADLSNMATKCLSLHKELEQAQETIHKYKMTIGECERRVGNRSPSDVKDRDMDQGDWDMVEPTIEQLQARIRDLEEEKATMIREHESALINAAERIGAADRKLDELAKEKADMTQQHLDVLVNAKNRILAAEEKVDELATEKATMIRKHDSALINAAERIGATDRKLDELDKEKADMIQEHQDAIANANDRILAAEQKVLEYEMMHLASQAVELVQTDSAATPEQIASPSSGKRQRPEDGQDASTQWQGSALQKTRKRRQTTKARGAVTIVG